MKTNIRRGIFHLTKYALFFFIILLQSCISTSVMRLEGNDFKENLSDQWEGQWTYGPGRMDIYKINISKTDENKVHLTGFLGGGGGGPGSDEVYGRIENSTLLLSWPTAWEGNCKDELRMTRNNSNNLILNGQLKCGGWVAKSRLKKIEWQIRIEQIWYKNNAEILVAVVEQDSNIDYISPISMN